MSGRDQELQRLREAFAAGERAAPGAECPTAERLWEAARGELEAEEVGRLADHAAACAACAEAWRLAKDLAGQPAPAATAEDQPAARGNQLAARRARFRWIAATMVTAAAAVMILVGVKLLTGGPKEREPIFRGKESAIRSLVPEDRPLPRSGAVLRWEAPPGAVCDVTFSPEDLSFTRTIAGRTTGELALPAEELGKVPAGTRLIWRVTARLPDGTRVQSPTFANRLE